MGYGDLQLFDIIIFAGIAIFLVFRLRKVLGKRVGFQKNSTNASSSTKNAIKEDNIKNSIPDLEEDFSELKKKFPDNLKISFSQDTSKYVKDMLSSLQNNVIAAIV